VRGLHTWCRDLAQELSASCDEPVAMSDLFTNDQFARARCHARRHVMATVVHRRGTKTCLKKP